MKSAALLFSEKSSSVVEDSATSSARLTENAKKVQKMLKKRRELMATQGKLKIEENNVERKPHKDAISNQKSEPTSEEYDDDDEEHPELTLTENSESYDSNDSLHGVIGAKELMDKGFKFCLMLVCQQ
jgi:hypothetical protein